MVTFEENVCTYIISVYLIKINVKLQVFIQFVLYVDMNNNRVCSGVNPYILVSIINAIVTLSVTSAR